MFSYGSVILFRGRGLGQVVHSRGGGMDQVVHGSGGQVVHDLGWRLGGPGGQV